MRSVVLGLFVFFASLNSALAGFVSGGVIQVGHYDLVWEPFEKIDHKLEILPGNRFRYWDSATGQGTFFYEGRITNVQHPVPKKTEFVLEVERDGRLLNGKIVPVSTAEVNLKIKRIKFFHQEQFIPGYTVMDREISTYNQPFRIHRIAQTIYSSGNFQRSEFYGFPVKY